jgi:hypothetical protein
MLLKGYFTRWTICIAFIAVGSSHGQNVSFVVGADNRNYAAQYRAALQEINDGTVNLEPSVPFPLFFVACGDIDPVNSNMAIYNDTLTYPNLPPYYPVVGNHELETPADMDYILNILIPNLDKVVNTGKQGTYSFDYGNVHCIVLDEYSTNGEGEVDTNLLKWLQQDLNTTTQDHVFVFGHEPAFPRHRHIGDSLDQFPESRNAFWNMLVMDPRVRAFFCGHTHYYNRMRVVDPTSVGLVGQPDQKGGVYEVDVGAIGNPIGDDNLTLVYVHVQEESIRFLTIQSPRTDIQWEVSDQWHIKGIKRFETQLLEPLAGDEVSGVINVTWSISEEVASSMTTTLYVSRDAGARWDTLWTEETGETTYAWNTEENPDGTQYLLRVVSKSDSGFGMAQSKGTFIINNPVNAIPDIRLLSPNEGDFISGEWPVRWFAADADADLLSFAMNYSTDNGLTWSTLFSNLQNSSEYSWNTIFAANSPNYRLVFRCSDGTIQVSDTSGVFEVFNERMEVPTSQINHIEGISGAIITAQFVDPDQLIGNLYRITFDDTLFDHKVYDVLNVDAGENVVENATQLDGVSEGPLFDGIRLLIRDFEQAVVDQENTVWSVGSSTLDISISLPSINLGNEILEGFPHPADYKISIFDHVVDTSSTTLGAAAIPMMFTVWNLTEDIKADIIFIETDNNQTISLFDEIFILEPDPQGVLRLTWSIFFSGTQNDSPPMPGDEFVFRTLKPLTSEDVYEFRVIPTSVRDNSAPIPRVLTLFQNYPNPFNPTTTIAYSLAYRSKVVLTIYNLLGQEVKKLINKIQTPGNKWITWDGRDNQGDIVGAGVFIYTIRTGTRIEARKMVRLP